MKAKHPFVPALLLALSACQGEPGSGLQGYVETESLDLSATVAGQLSAVSVVRGNMVDAGSELFRLDDAREARQIEEARAALAAAEALLADLGKGRRQEELAVIEAQQAQAATALALAERQLERTTALRRRQLVSPEDVDEAASRERQARQRLAELEASLASARLGGRDDARRQAEAGVDSARSRLAQAEWQLAQRRVSAPQNGLVQEVLFRPGEVINAGQPVVRLLPPERTKIRFYIPETELPRYRPGQLLHIRCDGCAKPVPVNLRYISPEAEYTPPVIYSKENRAKFVYLAEAWPGAGDGVKLRPGQPVDVLPPENNEPSP